MAERPPRVHLLCGLPAAGKTTYARKLAEELPAVRFTLDEWMVRLYGLGYDDPEYASRLEPCQELIWDVASQVLSLGHDVVLDWSQWSRSRRSRWRAIAAEAGHDVLLHYLDVPVETACDRATHRATNDNRWLSFHVIDRAGVMHMAALLEPPGQDEGIEIKLAE